MGSAAQIKMKMKLAVLGATALLLPIVRNFANENEIQQGLRIYSARPRCACPSLKIRFRPSRRLRLRLSRVLGIKK